MSSVPHCRKEVPKSRVDRTSKYPERGWLAIVSPTTHPNAISCEMIHASHTTIFQILKAEWQHVILLPSLRNILFEGTVKKHFLVSGGEQLNVRKLYMTETPSSCSHEANLNP
jgi:hypothetical protein